MSGNYVLDMVQAVLIELHQPEFNQNTPIPLGIDKLRQINRILDEIDTQLSKQTFDQSGLELELQPEDALYLADRMLAFCNRQITPDRGFIELYDHFTKVKQEALKQLTKQNP